MRYYLAAVSFCILAGIDPERTALLPLVIVMVGSLVTFYVCMKNTRRKI